jgi:hypothetical protein
MNKTFVLQVLELNLQLCQLNRRHSIWTFNIGAVPCYNLILNSWLSQEASDEDITKSDTITPLIELQRPITKSRAQQLCHRVNSLLCSSANELDNRLLPNDLIVIRNQGVDHGGHVRHQEVYGEPRKYAQQGGGTIQFGVQVSDFEFNSDSRTTLLSN